MCLCKKSNYQIIEVDEKLRNVQGKATATPTCIAQIYITWTVDLEYNPQITFYVQVYTLHVSSLIPFSFQRNQWTNLY
jgi:hypothetical protein